MLGSAQSETFERRAKDVQMASQLRRSRIQRVSKATPRFVRSFSRCWVGDPNEPTVWACLDYEWFISLVIIEILWSTDLWLMAGGPPKSWIVSKAFEPGWCHFWARVFRHQLRMTRIYGTAMPDSKYHIYIYIYLLDIYLNPQLPFFWGYQLIPIIFRLSPIFKGN